ncbi:uncharacterized protein LOC135808177, partial [Sycon ciliatum]|uniref:uncharacterized protein LOC135808177 n=1 Tax=Sycon ciliatum TaxID=27933 RepID=UPI0031F622F6
MPGWPKGPTEVGVSYAAHPHSFFCQRMDEAEDLDALMGELELHASSFSPLSETSPGTLCCAQYTLDDGWYRAKVVQVTASQATVHYVDYGNSETLPISRLRAIPPRYTQVYGYALHCSLSGIIADSPDGQWSERASARLAALVPDVDVFIMRLQSATSNAEAVGQVDLIGKESKVNVAQVLVKEGLAQQSNTGSDTSNTAEPEKLSVAITFASSPSEFWYQVEGASAGRLDELFELLASSYQGDDAKLAFASPELGDWCGMYSSDDQLWYRTVVTCQAPLTVRYLDYGNIEYPQTVRRLPEQALQLSPQAFQGCLLGVRSTEADGAYWSEAACADFLDWCNYGEEMFSAIRYDGAYFELTTSAGESVSDLLVQRGHGQVDRANARQALSMVAQLAPTVAHSNLAISDDWVDVMVSHATSPQSFYVQLCQNCVAFRHLTQQLSSAAASASPLQQPLKAGDMCAVQYENDWCRGKVVAVDATGNRYQVFFCDFGNTEALPLSALRPIAQWMCVQNQQAIRCSLVGAGAAANNPGAVNVLRSYAQSQTSLVAQVKQRNEDGHLMLNLMDTVSSAGKDLNVLQAVLSASSSAAASAAGAPAASDTSGKPTPSSSTTTTAATSASRPSAVYTYPSISHGKTFSATVTHCVSPSEIYLTLDSMAEALDTLMAGLEEAGPTLQPLTARVNGTPCCAVFSLDEGYYRAQLTSDERSGAVDVQFVDYGNSESRTADLVLDLPDQFIKTPLCSLRCSLADLQPQQTWPQAACEEVTSLLTDAAVQVTVMGGEYSATSSLAVRLLLDGNNVAEILRKKNLASPAQGTATAAVPPAPSTASPQQAPAAAPPAAAEARSAPQQLPQANVQTGSHKGFFIHADSPNHFCVQLNDHAAQLESIASDLQRVSRTPARGCNVGDFVVAPFSEDNALYRARIVQLSDTAARVSYVDYGNSDTCPASSMLQCPDNLLKIPAMAIRCSLLNIVPATGNTWDERVNKVIQGIAERADQMTIKFHQCSSNDDAAGVWSVSVQDMQNRDLGDYLLSSRMARRADQGAATPAAASRPATNNTSTATARDSAPVPSSSSAVASVQLRSLSLEAGFSSLVSIPYAVSPSEFCCHLDSNAAQLDQMMGQLEEIYTSANIPPLLVNAESGVACAAQFTEDDVWYRAVVQSAEAPDSYSLVYADYGNSETLSRQRVRMLAPALSSLPTQAARCCLHGSMPSNTWPEGVCAKFDEIVRDEAHQFRMEVVSVLSGVFIVKLYDETNTCFSDIFTMSAPVSAAPSPAIQQPVSTKPPTRSDNTAFRADTVHKGTLSFFVSPQCFFVQMDAVQTDIAEIMNTLASSETDYLSAAVAGTLCAACASDGTWYRGQVSEVKGVQITVDFIDYGFSETVALENMSELPAGVCTQRPALATCCRFYGIPDNLELAEAAHAMAESLCEQPVVVAVRSTQADSVLEVDVTMADERNFAQILGLATSPYTPPAAAQPAHSAAATSTRAPATPSSGSASSDDSLVIPAVHLQSGAACTVSVWECHSPISVWCQLSDDASLATIDELQEALANHCASAAAPSRVTPGMSCAALFDEDGIWYRATVQKRVDAQSFKVVFSDFGNSQVVSITNLRQLSPALVQQPAFAFRCVLAGFEDCVSSTFYQSVCSALSKLVLEQQLQATQVGSCVLDGLAVPVCEIMDVNGLNIADSLKSSTTPTPPADLPVVAMPAMPAVGQQMSVFVSYVSSASDVWLQPSSTADELAALQEKLCVAYGDGTSVSRPEILSPGMCVVAVYEEDGGFYRGEVQRVTPRTAEVFFVDYGNSQTIQKADIYSLTNEFVALPRQAILCQLNMQPADGVKERMEELLMDKEGVLSVQLVNTATCVHGTLSVDGVDVVNTLQPAQQAAVAATSAPAAAVAAATCSAVDLVDYCTLVKPGETHIVRWVEVVTPDEMYVQRADAATEDALADLQEEMKVYYASAGHSVAANDVAKDSFFAAQFSEDDGWYRAVVLAVDGDKAHVSFVDYGNKEWCGFERLRHLEAQFTSLPQQSFCLALPVDSTDVEGWTSEAADMITALDVDTVKAVILSADDGYVIANLSSDTDIVAQVLVAGGLAVHHEFAAPHEEVGASPQSSPAQSDNSSDLSGSSPEQTGLSPYRFEDEHAKDAHVVVSFVTSPFEFYCQPMSLSDALADQQAAIETYVTESASPDSTMEPHAGMYCLAMFEDQCWYRALIEAVADSATSVSVFFVDYGNQGEISVSNLLPLPAQFTQLPWSAVKCSMFTVEPCAKADSWPATATDVFTEAVQDQELLLSLNSLLDGEPPIYFVDPLDMASQPMSAVLISSGLADKTCSDVESVASGSAVGRPHGDAWLAHCSPTSGTAVRVLVSLVASPFEIWCQLVVDADNLNALAQDLADVYGSEQQQPARLQVEELVACKACVAQFSEDECWYRAVILNVDHGAEKACVRFVDFGNTDTVDFSCIKVLLPVFTHLPEQAFHLSLQGIRTADDDDSWSPEVQDFLQVMEGTECDVIVSNVSDANDHAASSRVFFGQMRNADGEDVATWLTRNGYAQLIKAIDAAVPPSPVLPCSPTPSPAAASASALSPSVPAGAESSSRSTSPLSSARVSSSSCLDLSPSSSSPSPCVAVSPAAAVAAAHSPARSVSPVASVSPARSVSPVPSASPIRSTSPVVPEQCLNDQPVSPQLSPAAVSLSPVARSPSPARSPVARSPSPARSPVARSPSPARSPIARTLSPARSPVARNPSPARSPVRTCSDASTAAATTADPPLETGQLVEQAAANVSAVPSTTSFAANSVGRIRRDAHEARSQSSWSIAASTASEPGQAGAGDLLALGQTVAMEITHVETPTDFWCQVRTNASSLERMMDLLNSQQPPVLAEPTVGNICCAMYTEDNRLYRGCVDSITGEMACVRFTDYGNSQECALTDIYELPRACFLLPMQAIHSELAYSNPVAGNGAEWSTEAIDRFQELVVDGVDATLAAGVSKLAVELHVSSVSVLDTLIAEGHAVLGDSVSHGQAAVETGPTASVDMPESLPVPLVDESAIPSSLSPSAAPFTPTGHLPSGGRLLTPDSMTTDNVNSCSSPTHSSSSRSASPLTTRTDTVAATAAAA